jgi:hypothetical protein
MRLCQANKCAALVVRRPFAAKAPVATRAKGSACEEFTVGGVSKILSHGSGGAMPATALNFQSIKASNRDLALRAGCLNACG